MICRKKIVFGTYAYMLPISERAKFNGTTHEWTCILRGEDPLSDLSCFIKKVVFVLHPSFVNNTKVFENTKHFCFTEYGWGEFEIVCKISFIDPDEKSIELRHYLKLYPDGTIDINAVEVPSLQDYRNHCVVSETRDEIIFSSCSKILIDAVQQSYIDRIDPLPCSEHFQAYPFDKETEFIRFHTLLQNSIRNETELLKSQLIEKTTLLNSLMNIYYCCRPDKALQILASHPQAFSLCAGEQSDSYSIQTLLENIRSLTKSIANKNDDKTSLDAIEVDECINAFKELVSAGLLGSTLGTCYANRFNKNTGDPSVNIK